MNKKKLDVLMMETAKLWAKASYCKRAQVGAVIAKDERIISIGYNGTFPGEDNNCEKNINGELKTDHSKVIHAEANAILFAAKNGIPLNGTTMYVTMSPCAECAKMIIQSGIREVVYLEEYRDLNSIKKLEKAKIIVRKYKGG